ncbi:hypothetical protein GYMLUDRAFT_246263 [Collybiopsis luxurians FD-317 M1]|uniref:Uncharacterized protein n=1 Tax=Collybiopsis luxurians FD-317 M1 TaxID=944289 RepID=A0A0D0CIS9_9AGAR|nr:hypothetical protein GYMLUDRAFT_246263 [Collybiopsis luxurians FD-317 M1]
MPGAYVGGVYDSVLHPMFLCLSLCPLDKTRKSTVQKRLTEIDAAVRDRKTKFRPCFVIPEQRNNIEGGRGKTKICLMATFDGLGINQLPLMLRHFVIPVKTDSKDCNAMTLQNAEYITTDPLWKAKVGGNTQWVICFLYEVNTADLGAWRGGIALTVAEEEHLVKLCELKRETWFDQVNSRSAARVLMLNSILTFAKGTCEDRKIFASNITIVNQGESRATIASQATYQTRKSQLRGSGLRQSTRRLVYPIKENCPPVDELPSKEEEPEKRQIRSIGSPLVNKSVASLTQGLRRIAIEA